MNLRGSLFRQRRPAGMGLAELLATLPEIRTPDRLAQASVRFLTRHKNLAEGSRTDGVPVHHSASGLPVAARVRVGRVGNSSAREDLPLLVALSPGKQDLPANQRGCAGETVARFCSA